jgi:hypothetical protein
MGQHRHTVSELTCVESTVEWSAVAAVDRTHTHTHTHKHTHTHMYIYTHTHHKHTHVYTHTHTHTSLTPQIPISFAMDLSNRPHNILMFLMRPAVFAVVTFVAWLVTWAAHCWCQGLSLDCRLCPRVVSWFDLCVCVCVSVLAVCVCVCVIVW